MNYCVYIHRNKQNNKVYIGQTCQNPSRRWGINGEGYKGCTHFYNAIQKYGWDNFQHIIIKDNLTHKQANILEQQLIQQYNSIENGYNIRLGGSYSAPDNHREVICLNTQEIFSCISDAAEKYLNDRNNGHITEVCKGNRSHAGKLNDEFLAWAYLDEYLDNSEKFLNFSIKKKGHTNKKIICITTGEIFNTIQDAVKWCGQKGNANIIKVCKGQRKTSGKHPKTGEPLQWKYYN